MTEMAENNKRSLPDGLRYHPDFIERADQEKLVEIIRGIVAEERRSSSRPCPERESRCRSG